LASVDAFFVTEHYDNGGHGSIHQLLSRQSND